MCETGAGMMPTLHPQTWNSERSAPKLIIPEGDQCDDELGYPVLDLCPFSVRVLVSSTELRPAFPTIPPCRRLGRCPLPLTKK